MDQNIKDCFKKSLDETAIPGELYKKYSVKKGLRNEDGTGVLVGLTNISDVVGYKKVDGEKVDDYRYLKYYLYKCSIGDKVTFKYIRNGKTLESSVVLKG